MGMDLNGAGGYWRMSGSSFARALTLAKKHGWEPAGTKAPYWVNEDGTPCEEMNVGHWDGGYGSNDHQGVTDDDAKALGAALTRALDAGKEFVDDPDTEKFMRETAAFFNAGGFSIG